MDATGQAKQLLNVVGVGDTHGKFGELGFNIRVRYGVRDSVILLCGDITMGYNSHAYYVSEFKKLNAIAKETNCVIFGVRGNHDDPAYFDGNFEFSNVRLVRDYETVESFDSRILFIGGAVSVDRKDSIADMEAYRLKNLRWKKTITKWWPGEEPFYDEELLRAAGKTDIVATHTAPAWAWPQSKVGLMDWTKKDPALIDDCSRERMVMSKVYDYLEANECLPYWWAYGHFHASKVDFNSARKTRFRLLDVLEFAGLNDMFPNVTKRN